MKKICFFLNLLLLSCLGLAAQKQTDSSKVILRQIPDSLKFFSLRMLPANYYAANLGFFCKKEIQIQKAIKLPVKFRLGTVEYTDKLEGKNTQPH